MKEFTIGIDIGTSGCKCAAVDIEGSILMEVMEPYPLACPQTGWTQQDPEAWWNAVVLCCRRLSALDCRKLLSIGFSGQMHGMVALDAKQVPVYPAILWNDQRTAEQCRNILALAGGTPGLVAQTNNGMLTGYTGGKIVWLKEHEPECFARTSCVVNPKDYIRFRFVGQLATDESDASGFGLYDVRRNRWATELIERCGLPASLFPPVSHSAGVAGRITAEAAGLTGLPSGTPVIYGGGDAVLSHLGMGVFSGEEVCVTLGTSGVVSWVSDAFLPNTSSADLQIFRDVLDGCFSVFGVTLSAAGSFQWFRNAFGGTYSELDELALTVPKGAEGLLFHPYLCGERCPVNDPQLRGSFHGISLSHTKAHFSRSILEGVAFSLRSVLELVQSKNAGCAPKRVILGGGGAKSAVWRQIMADVFRLPVCFSQDGAGDCAYAAALLAMLGQGRAGDVQAIFQRHQWESCEPEDPDAYTAPYDAYRASSQSLQQFKNEKEWRRSNE